MKGEQVFVAVGLDRRGVNPAPRELLSPPCGGADAILEEVAGPDCVDEVAFLYTGRQAEAPAAARFPSLAATSLRQAIAGLAGEELPTFELGGEAAFHHLVRGAAGLGSSALAEPHAAALVKGSLDHAHARLVGAALRAPLAQHALAEAEKIVDEEVERWLRAEAAGREGGGGAPGAAAAPGAEPAPAGAAHLDEAR